jgi:predicted dehydrogenase
VADVDRPRATDAARRYDIPVVASDVAELMANPDVDVIDVCVPPLHHAPVVIAALNAGKHVVCEKPLATSLADADRILESERVAKGKLCVVHQMRFHPVYQRLKWLTEGKHLGSLCLARVVRYDQPPRALVERGTWGRWDQSGGGVVMTKAVHQLDLLLWLLGPVKSVQATMDTYLFPIESEDHAIASIRFESGALADVCLSGYPYGYHEQFDLIGDKGAAGLPWHLKLRDSGLTAGLAAELEALFPLGSKWKRKVSEVIGPGRISSWLLPEGSWHEVYLKAVVGALEGRRAIPVTATEARQAVELCTAIYEAALTGRTVELPISSSNRFYKGVQKHEYADSRKPALVSHSY